MTSGEFELIGRIHERARAGLGAPPEGQTWIGDDAAVLEGGLLVATDTLVEGVHARLDWCGPEAFGWKALAVNLSDVAAMGGEPVAAVVALTLPPGSGDLGDGVMAGLLDAATTHRCPVVGGDTTSGPALVVTVTVLGRAPATGAVLRSGGRPGDAVMVTGPLGGPAVAVAALLEGTAPAAASAARLHRPVPRLAEGALAAGAGATAMIDVSDGLAADVGHICERSGTGVELHGGSIPLGPGASLADALGGGDDYELVVCAPDPTRVAGAFTAAGLTAPVVIGHLTEGPARLLDGARLPASGWRHEVS
jgi:thiamine-monophosphate kinase